MAIEERLPPACAFAVSVLQEHELDPEAVPEEALEAAQKHLTTCIRCLSSPPVITPAVAAPRKRKRVRRPLDEAATLSPSTRSSDTTTLTNESPRVTVTLEEALSPQRSTAAVAQRQSAPPASIQPASPPPVAPPPTPQQTLPAILENLGGIIDCVECRQLLPEYVEVMDEGKNVAELYPEVHEHLLICDSGCLVLLDLFRQEAKAMRKYRRRPVRDPFSIIGWEISGFFRTGRVPVSPMALAYGTLILLLLVASLSAFLAVHWDDARYYHAPINSHTLPTPDGIGLSDGLHIYDACNATGYQDKRAAAQALQQNNTDAANNLLNEAVTSVNSDTTGCNGGEAAIYQADLQARQSGHPLNTLVVSFDSGPGDANPQGGTNRHNLYAAYTQELVGAYISQSQFNSAQIKIPGAPLLYLILANTTGVAQGALQVANAIANLPNVNDLNSIGLLLSGQASLLGVLGLAPSNLLQVALPVLCRAGIPIISPTATGRFIIDQLTNTSMYQHCAPGFAFVRFSADDLAQSDTAANYAYYQLGIRNAAVFYDPSNPSSADSAQDFLSSFSQRKQARIVAQETAVSDSLLDINGRPAASSSVLLAGLTDALQSNPRPELIFAPMLTNDVLALAQAIAELPSAQQPVLMMGGEFVHPSALQSFVQWTRQQRLSLPRIYVSLNTAARPPVSDWSKQFYASFCESFATPGSFCSGTAALDQGALLFADGIEMLSMVLDPSTGNQFPSPTQLIQKLGQENFGGVSGPIITRTANSILITSSIATPIILGLQTDSSLQIMN